MLLLSIFLVFISAFFIANVLDSKNLTNNIIYIFLLIFANIVFTFEFLSLFSGISKINVLIVNFIIGFVSIVYWVINNGPIIKFNFKAILNKIVQVIKLDKTIALLLCGFIFACIVSLFLIAIIPGIDIDSTTYRVVRAMFWIAHGNLNHFPIAEARVLMFPINSEILYAWFMLFLNNDNFLFIFNFCGLGFFLTVLYGLLSEITISLRRKLWVILVVASIPFIILRYTGLDTGLLITGLALGTIYLYIRYLKDEKESLGYMSALALALGVGTKTTMILLLPALILWFIWYSWYCKQRVFYKPLLRFSLYFILNFLLFSAYNYISNYINYGHFISSLNIALIHTNSDGFFSTFSNLFRYVFDFFSFPEFLWSANLSSIFIYFRDSILTLLNANVGFGRTHAVYNYIPHSVSSASAALGFFGPLLFIPMYIVAIKNSILFKNRKQLLLVSLLYLFLVTVVIMSYKLAFMSYNIRFLITFALLTTPIIFYAYSKRYHWYKLIITLIAFVYMVALSINITLYPLKQIVKVINDGASISLLRKITECSFYKEDLNIHKYKVRDIACRVQENIKKYNPKNRILYFSSSADSIMPILRLMFEGYTIETALASEIDNVNLDDYNIIIIRDNYQASSTNFSFQSIDHEGNAYNQGILCNYWSFNKSFIKNLSNEYQLFDESRCHFTRKFFKIHNNLKLHSKSTYRVGRNEDGSVKYQTYRFYENLNNPVIKD